MLHSNLASNTRYKISRQLPIASQEIPKEFKMTGISVNIQSSNDLPLSVNYCQNYCREWLVFILQPVLLCPEGRLYMHFTHTLMPDSVLYSDIGAVL